MVKIKCNSLHPSYKYYIRFYSTFATKYRFPTAAPFTEENEEKVRVDHGIISDEKDLQIMGCYVVAALVANNTSSSVFFIHGLSGKYAVPSYMLSKLRE